MLSNFAYFFWTVLAILGPLRLGHLAHLCKGIAGLFVHWRGGAQGQASAPPLSNIPGTQAAALKVAALEAWQGLGQLKEHCHPDSTRSSTMCLPCDGSSATFYVLSLKSSTLYH